MSHITYSNTHTNNLTTKSWNTNSERVLIMGAQAPWFSLLYSILHSIPVWRVANWVPRQKTTISIFHLQTFVISFPVILQQSSRFRLSRGRTLSLWFINLNRILKVWKIHRSINRDKWMSKFLSIAKIKWFCWKIHESPLILWTEANKTTRFQVIRKMFRMRNRVSWFGSY